MSEGGTEGKNASGGAGTDSYGEDWQRICGTTSTKIWNIGHGKPAVIDMKWAFSTPWKADICWKIVTRSPFIPCHLSSVCTATLSALEIRKCHSRRCVPDWSFPTGFFFFFFLCQLLNLQLENFAVQIQGNKCIFLYVHTHVCIYFSPLDTLICSLVSHALKPIRSSDIKPLPANQHDTSASLISRPWESSYWFSVWASEKKPFVFMAIQQ